jgi:hypothetical protein
MTPSRFADGYDPWNDDDELELGPNMVRARVRRRRWRTPRLTRRDLQSILSECHNLHCNTQIACPECLTCVQHHTCARRI